RLPSRFATAKPTLWRVFAYPSPGLPSPTTSLSALGAPPPPKNLRTFLLDAEKGRGIAAGSLSRSRLLLPPVYGAAPWWRPVPDLPRAQAIGRASVPACVWRC